MLAVNNVDRFFSTDAKAFADSYIAHISDVLARIDRNEIAQFISTLLDARENGATVFFIGNGGSASTASHFANDLAIGTNSYEKPFRTVSLADNQAIISAVGNDFGYQDVFLRQIRILGKPRDVLVAISASGNSQNLISAFEFAKSARIKTVALTAFDGGKLREMADEIVHVPTESKEYGPAEDAHLILNHLVGNYLMRLVKST